MSSYVLHNQFFCDLVSWSDGTLELYGVAVIVLPVKSNLDTHGAGATHHMAVSTSTIGLTRIFVSILISCFSNTKTGEQTGGDDEQCLIYQVTHRTDALSSAKCEGDRRVISECPIFVEESLRLEFFRFCVVENRPWDFHLERYYAGQLLTTYHVFMIVIEPIKGTVSSVPHISPSSDTANLLG